jgi:hypothetical protein
MGEPAPVLGADRSRAVDGEPPVWHGVRNRGGRGGGDACISHADELGRQRLQPACHRAAVAEHPVNVGVRTAEELVDYRFGQAPYAGWLAGLAPARRRAVRHAVIDAVTPVMEPYQPIVVLLVANRATG